MDPNFPVDERGFPVALADGAAARASNGAPVAVPAPPPPPPSARPAAVDHVEWSRRQDAVREAAREFEDLSPQDLKERLRGVTTKPLTDSELTQFTADVRAAALDDLIDALDQVVRGKQRGRRTVRLMMPRGYMPKALRSLSTDEADQVESRLRSRGWNDKQVRDELRDRLKHLDGQKTHIQVPAF